MLRNVMTHLIDLRTLQEDASAVHTAHWQESNTAGELKWYHSERLHIATSACCYFWTIIILYNTLPLSFHQPKTMTKTLWAFNTIIYLSRQQNRDSVNEAVTNPLPCNDWNTPLAGSSHHCHAHVQCSQSMRITIFTPVSRSFGQWE